MPITLYESGADAKKKKPKLATSILEGVVVNNCDPAGQSKVLVRIPSLNQEVWARMSSPGAGSDAGLFYTPRPDDEVLVAFSGSELGSAYILGGLWNTQDSPPISKNPVDVMTKRVIKTGVAGGIGHEIEFDDGVGQSITITTSTKQKIKLDKEKIEISTTGGTVSVTLDLLKQTVSIQAANIEIGGSKTAQIKLAAKKIDIGGSDTVTTNIKGAQVVIQGTQVRIN
jgi:uncharacterized protein involved in type VI secretion and phage assembly